MGGYCESQGPAIGSQASFKILSGTAGIPHFFSSSAVLLQWRSKFWKLAWEPIAAYFWSKCRTQLEISVSKMGLMLPDLKNHSKSVKSFRLKNGKSWCLANEHFFFPSSAVLLQWRSKSWKLSREPVEAAFSWKIRVRLEISVYNF